MIESIKRFICKHWYKNHKYHCTGLFYSALGREKDLEIWECKRCGEWHIIEVGNRDELRR